MSAGDDGGAIARGDLRHYGRRHGRSLRPGRRRALAHDLDAVVLKLPDQPATAIDPRLAFTPPRPRVWLEIGFGAGEHLLGQAARHGDIGLIGCEPFLNGVAALVSRTVAGGFSARVRVFADDARLLLPRLVEASIERVFLLFPDPWPKRRHHRRRLIDGCTIDGLAAALADGGEVRFASDDHAYAAATLALIDRHPAFAPFREPPAAWRRPPEDWVSTRYEAKARAAGRVPLYFRFFRLKRAENLSIR